METSKSAPLSPFIPQQIWLLLIASMPLDMESSLRKLNDATLLTCPCLELATLKMAQVP